MKIEIKSRFGKETYATIEDATSAQVSAYTHAAAICLGDKTLYVSTSFVYHEDQILRIEVME